MDKKNKLSIKTSQKDKVIYINEGKKIKSKNIIKR